jgi:hypothetical protein
MYSLCIARSQTMEQIIYDIWHYVEQMDIAGSVRLLRQRQGPLVACPSDHSISLRGKKEIYKEIKGQSRAQ